MVFWVVGDIAGVFFFFETADTVFEGLGAWDGPSAGEGFGIAEVWEELFFFDLILCWMDDGDCRDVVD